MEAARGKQRLSRLQDTLPLKCLGPGLGALALLPLLRRLDQSAAIAAPLWHAVHAPRLVSLLLAALLLSFMLWQWQQLELDDLIQGRFNDEPLLGRDSVKII